MHTDREQEIIGILRRNDHKGISFTKTKKQLLAKGYSEGEIVYCLYSAPYDGKPNAQKEENPLKKFYEQHPAKAEEVAKTLLKDLRGKRASALAHAAASRFAPSPHARAFHEVRMFDILGIPYFTLFFIGIGLMVLMLKFHWPRIILDVYVILVSIFVAYKLWRYRK